MQSNWAGVGFPRSPWLCTVDPLPRRSVRWMPYAGSPGFKWGETVIRGQKESSWCPPSYSVFMGKLTKVCITIDFSEKNKKFSKGHRKYPKNEGDRPEAEANVYFKIRCRESCGRKIRCRESCGSSCHPPTALASGLRNSKNTTRGVIGSSSCLLLLPCYREQSRRIACHL